VKRKTAGPTWAQRLFDGIFPAGPKAPDSAIHRLTGSLGTVQQVPFIEACADLAQLGLSAEGVETIAHAMTRRRILAFGGGTITDLGEAGNHLDGSTRGSRTYEGDRE
jgi:hypothetical protein